MHRTTVALLTVIIFAALTTVTLAQGRGAGPSLPKYDVKTEATLTGTIEDVQQQPCMGRRNGTHLTLKTQSETAEVCVGPATYVQEKGFSFAKGEQVEVIGSRVKFSGRDVVVARQVTKGNQVLTLRDAQGIPAWSGGRRRNN